MEKINHEANTLMTACGIDETEFQARIDYWVKEMNANGVTGSKAIEGLENSFTHRELAFLTYKGIEEITAMHQLLGQITKQ